MYEVFIPKYGPPEVFQERPIGARNVGPGQVRVRVRASGVNFADIMQRLGLYASSPKPPYAPGFEIAGEVVEVGDGVQHVVPGDAVGAAMPRGGYAQEVLAPAERVLKLPAGMSMRTAAAIPVNYLTAWFCLYDMGALRKGSTVLIHHGAGGVGVAAIQLSRWTGARVLATTGTAAKLDFLRGLGVDGAFCIGEPDWKEQVEKAVGKRSVDVVLDPVGGKVMKQGMELLAPLGRLVAFGLSQAVAGPGRNLLRAAIAYFSSPRINPLQLTTFNTGVFGFHLAHLYGKEQQVAEALQQIIDMTAAGTLAPQIDSTFPLSAAGAAAAHHRIHSRGNRGKVLLVDEG